MRHAELLVYQKFLMMIRQQWMALEKGFEGVIARDK
jgi:hypothetical protein